jgi:hypothetical protein
MNHPSEEWKDLESFELSKDKKRFICRDIRFNKVEPDDLDDHQKCFLWELNRTLLYKDIKVDTEYPQDEFPFYVESFPKKAYLSHPFKQRSIWRIFKNSETIDYDDCLLLESSGTREIVEGLGSKIPATKVPLTIHINPDWPREKIRLLLREQFDLICTQVQTNKNIMLINGHVFFEKDTSKPIVTLQTKLKHLGHYRLNQCVNLSWVETQNSYGEGKYRSEPDFRRDLRKIIPLLPLS